MFKSLEDLKISYEKKKQLIRQRLEEFRKKRSEDEIFAELCFCLLTPQSKARAADKAISILSEKNILMSGSEKQIAGILESAGVRFPQNKAKYIVEARKFQKDLKSRLNINDIEGAREWFVENVKGLGYKEASHFLRNIGFSGLAILDRHILKNLYRLGAISEMPKTLTRKKYLEIEGIMKRFVADTGITIDELDLLLWSEETGEIFK